MTVDTISAHLHPVKIDLNKKLYAKQKTIQTFNIDAQELRKNPTRGNRSYQLTSAVPANLPTMGRLASITVIYFQNFGLVTVFGILMLIHEFQAYQWSS